MSYTADVAQEIATYEATGHDVWGLQPYLGASFDAHGARNSCPSFPLISAF